MATMQSDVNKHLSGADVGVLIGYFIVVILVGILAMWRSNRGTVTGYFLAGRSMSFLPIGASLFVSNIGTEHFIGLSGSGAASGISVGAWEINALLLLQLLGWVFLPVYIACGICTMPEYLSRRFGGQRLRTYFACMSLLLYILTKCSGDLYTGALFIQQSLDWDLYLSIVILVTLTALLTITGGLTAVIYTDTLQAVLMLAGALYLMVLAFREVGGFAGLLERYPQAVPSTVDAIVVNTTCHWPDKQAFRMLRGAGDNYMPWLGFLLGQTPGSIWYWCTDQVIVQRALAAKNLSHARGATLLAGFIKLLPMFVMVFPGMISRVLYPNEVACTNPDYCMKVCQSRAGCSNIAYPRLVLGIMPNGARGLMMAVMIAALMSDLDSIFNSSSTLFTMDIWRKLRTAASNTELMIVGRLFVVVMVGVAIAWIPVIKETSGGQVFIYINEVTNYLAPPFAAVFLLAVLVPRVNEKGVFWSLMVAHTLGITRLVVKLAYQGDTHCGAQLRYMPAIISDFHYMYFALAMTVLTAVLSVVISCCSNRPDDKLLQATTVWTCSKLPHSEDTWTEMMSRDGEPEQMIQDVLNRNAKDPADSALHPQEEADVMTRAPGHDYHLGRRIMNMALRCICGVTMAPDVHQDWQDTSERQRPTVVCPHPEQTLLSKVLLTFGMVTVVGVGVAMYIFWSVYRFPTGPFYPDGAVRPLLGDV